MRATSTRQLVTEEEPLRVKEIATFFRVDDSTIYRAIQAGDLTAYRVGGKKRGPLRVPRAAFEAYKTIRTINPMVAA